jgi:uncharacterized glyoxalase superfamily protein PhnB
MRTGYQAVRQVKPQISRGDSVECALEAGTLALWSQSESEACRFAPMQGGAHHRVLMALAVEDVHGAYAGLKRLPMEWVQALPTQPWGHRACSMRDPDGTILNVHTAVEARHG